MRNFLRNFNVVSTDILFHCPIPLLSSHTHSQEKVSATGSVQPGKLPVLLTSSPTTFLRSHYAPDTVCPALFCLNTPSKLLLCMHCTYFPVAWGTISLTHAKFTSTLLLSLCLDGLPSERFPMPCIS